MPSLDILGEEALSLLFRLSSRFSYYILVDIFGARVLLKVSCFIYMSSLGMIGEEAFSLLIRVSSRFAYCIFIYKKTRHKMFFYFSVCCASHGTREETTRHLGLGVPYMTPGCFPIYACACACLVARSIVV